MPVISETTRRRIEAQGFIALEDDYLKKINFWLRFSPAICLAWTAFGVVLASPVVLWTLVPFALLGGILRRGHPFDAIYNHFLRYHFKSPPLSSYGLPRRFACLVAASMISAIAVSFQFGFPVAGYVLGGFMAAMAAVNITTGFCVPSFIYGLIFGKVYCRIESKTVAPN